MQHHTEWGEMADRLRTAVKRIGGPSAAFSGGLKVLFSSYGDVYVEVGGQDVDDWKKHEPVGRFDTEAQAAAATLKKVVEAEAMLSGVGPDA